MFYELVKIAVDGFDEMIVTLLSVLDIIINELKIHSDFIKSSNYMSTSYTVCIYKKEYR